MSGKVKVTGQGSGANEPKNGVSKPENGVNEQKEIDWVKLKLNISAAQCLLLNLPKSTE